jgi:hypothetical protein
MAGIIDIAGFGGGTRLSELRNSFLLDWSLAQRSYTHRLQKLIPAGPRTNCGVWGSDLNLSAGAAP